MSFRSTYYPPGYQFADAALDVSAGVPVDVFNNQTTVDAGGYSDIQIVARISGPVDFELKVLQSTQNDTDWDITNTYIIKTGAESIPIELQVPCRYVRISLTPVTNDTQNTANVRVATLLKINSTAREKIEARESTSDLETANTDGTNTNFTEITVTDPSEHIFLKQITAINNRVSDIAYIHIYDTDNLSTSKSDKTTGYMFTIPIDANDTITIPYGIKLSNAI